MASSNASIVDNRSAVVAATLAIVASPPHEQAWQGMRHIAVLWQASLAVVLLRE
jgi:hypothetical protein